MKKIVLLAVLGLAAPAIAAPSTSEALLLRRALQAAKRVVSSGVKSVSRTVTRTIKSGAKAVSGAVNKAVNAVKVFGAAAWSKLQSTAQKVWAKTVGGAAAMLRFLGRAKRALQKAKRYAKSAAAKAKAFMSKQAGTIKSNAGKLSSILKDSRMKQVVKRIVTALLKGQKPNSRILADLRTLGTRLGLVKRRASLGRRSNQAPCGSWKEFSPHGSWGISIGLNLSAIVIGVQISVGFMVDNDFKDARLFWVWSAGPATEVEVGADISLEFSRFKVKDAQGKGWGFNFGAAYKAGLSLGFEWAGDDLFSGRELGAFEISPSVGVGAGANFYYFECKTT